MASDAIGEAEAAAGSSKKSRRRISDYLGESDDGAEASLPSPETPPQLRLPRFTCARFRFVRLGRKRDGKSKEAMTAKKKTEDYSIAGPKPADILETSTSTSASAEAGGMGLSMLLLLARTCVELNRMAEVRAQMEALLKEMRDEAGRMKASARHRQHDVVVTPRTTTFSNLQLSSSSCTTDTDTNHHHHHAATEEIARREGEGKQAEGEERCSGSVVELELEAAESEAEPALQHLPPSLQCDTDQDESSDDEFIELDGGRHFGGGVNGDIKWDAGNVSEEESTREQDGGGVSAAELERRLHELLHRRNRDRIAELESALRRAEQRLREKEMEARLWQDTATLALQPPPRDGQ